VISASTTTKDSGADQVALEASKFMITRITKALKLREFQRKHQRGVKHRKRDVRGL
jgi:hypothetical protein